MAWVIRAGNEVGTVADDEVGVEPERLAQLASELENLRDVLAHNVPIIVNTLEQYWNSGTGTPVNLNPLKQAQTRSPEDASEMRSRSNLAQAWMNQAVNIDVVTGGKAYIPWDTADVDKADAQLQAQQLTAAEQSGNRAEIQAIEQDLQDHSSDKQWLADFWSQPEAATAAANLAAMLHKSDGSGTTPLTAADQKILSTYASSLAAACNLGGMTTAQGQQLVTAFTNAASSNPWSAAMLLKNGPAGNTYGTGANNVGANLLAGVTEQTLIAYANGSLNMPIDLRGAAQSGNEPSNSQIAAAVAANDPLTAMLALDTQNKTAAQEVMAGYNPVTGKTSQAAGADWASLLLTKANSHNTIYTPVYPKQVGSAAYMKIMLSDGPPRGVLDNGQTGPEWNTYGISATTIGNFLDAATSGPRGGGNLSTGEFSAYAAANIILSTPAPEGDNSIDLPQPIRQALASTFMRYMPDLSQSIANQDSAQGPQITDQIIDKNGQPVPGSWHFNIPVSMLSNYMQQVSNDPTTYGNLKAAVADKMGVALGMHLKGVSDGTNDDPYDDLAMLYGHLMQEQTTLSALKGHEEDVQHAMFNAMIDLAKDKVDMVPVVGDDTSKLISYDEKLKDLGFPQIPEFSTDNESNALQEGRQNFSDAQLTVMIPIVQGLVQTGEIKPQASWYQQGQVIPNQDFYNWWSYQKGLEITNYSAPVKDKSGNIAGYSPSMLNDLMRQASQDMGLGGSGFSSNLSGSSVPGGG
jgi:hypothetical protein